MVGPVVGMDVDKVQLSSPRFSSRLICVYEGVCVLAFMLRQRHVQAWVCVHLCGWPHMVPAHTGILDSSTHSHDHVYIYLYTFTQSHVSTNTHAVTSTLLSFVCTYTYHIHTAFYICSCTLGHVHTNSLSSW